MLLECLHAGGMSGEEVVFSRWGSSEPAVHLVPLDWLKPHEEILDKNVRQLEKMTLRWKGYTKPLLVDIKTGSILDGHTNGDTIIFIDQLRTVITGDLVFNKKIPYMVI